jgi:hypothetical protein
MGLKFASYLVCLTLLTAGCGVNTTVAPRTVPMTPPSKLIPAPPEKHPAPAGGQRHF